jgi:hypothetical protein
MEFDPREIVASLKLEISVLERGGYYPSVRQPHEELRIFRDSVTCPNLAQAEKTTPCSHCFLAQFIPAEHLDKKEPCHYIPLNAQGETVASLAAAGDRERLRRELLAWLRSMVAQVEQGEKQK